MTRIPGDTCPAARDPPAARPAPPDRLGVTCSLFSYWMDSETTVTASESLPPFSVSFSQSFFLSPSLRKAPSCSFSIPGLPLSFLSSLPPSLPTNHRTYVPGLLLRPVRATSFELRPETVCPARGQPGRCIRRSCAAGLSRCIRCGSFFCFLNRPTRRNPRTAADLSRCCGRRP